MQCKEKGLSLHIPQQFLCGHLHSIEGKPPLAKVFQRGSDMIDGVVDTQVAVVNTVVLLHVDGLVLSIMLRKVERKLLLDLLCVDGGRNLSFADVALARQRKWTFFALKNNVAPIRSRRHFVQRSLPEAEEGRRKGRSKS